MTWPRETLDNAISAALAGKPMDLTAESEAEARKLYYALHRRRAARGAAVTFRVDGATIEIRPTPTPPTVALRPKPPEPR